MEQISGGTLLDWLQNFEFSEQELNIIMYQLIKVAEYLSKCGIIHRDLKPANILVIKDEND